MKFSQMPYTRPNVEEIKSALGAIEEKLKNTKSAAEQLEAFRETEELGKKINTLGTLVYIRNTINTKDEFYAAEREYIDEVEPLYGEATQKVSLAMLASPFRAELEKELLEQVNALGIGPQGMGGRITALSVHIRPYATHIAGLPCAINMSCHATRHAKAVI